VTLEYVYVMRPEVADIVAELAALKPAPIEKGDVQKVQELVAHLTAADMNERLSATEAILAFGAAAAPVLADAIKNNADAETRERTETVLRKLWEKTPQPAR
jgi:DNA helicase TIP49 (TBP-interacting protein)